MPCTRAGLCLSPTRLQEHRLVEMSRPTLQVQRDAFSAYQFPNAPLLPQRQLPIHRQHQWNLQKTKGETDITGVRYCTKGYTNRSNQSGTDLPRKKDSSNACITLICNWTRLSTHLCWNMQEEVAHTVRQCPLQTELWSQWVYITLDTFDVVPAYLSLLEYICLHR